MTKTKFLKLGVSSWKAIFWLTLVLLLTFSVIPRGYAQSVDNGTATISNQPTVQQQDSEPTTFPYKKKFVISSYYTPLPGQSKYFTGSYEKDVRLNGEGVTAADGTKVYPGIAAAPKKIPFGTKIEIPAFGIVAIHDRGGAIKNDRLDIWVGAGEEGLRRAIAWGMRTVEVTVYGIDESIKESVNFTTMPLAEMTWLIEKTEYFKSDLSYGDNGESVRELQRTLKQLGYFDLDITGYFGDETKNSVQKFQLDESVINSADDLGAGNFGPKTRIALEKKLKNVEKQRIASLPTSGLRKGESGERVINLQKILKEYGYLNQTNGKFDQNTYEALLRFQLDFDVVKNNKEVGAGFYGPKTVAALNRMISDNFTPGVSLSKISLEESDTPEKIFTKTLAFNSKGSDVKLLQEELKRLNFLRLEPTGYYGKTTEHAVLKFQQAFDIVEDEKSEGAGVVGPKTTDKLNEIYLGRTQRTQQIAQATDEREIVLSRVQEEKKLVANLPEKRDIFGTELIYGTRGNDVERLQKILKRLGFFKGKLTTMYFGDITKNSLIAFQESHGVEGSGKLDEVTRRMLNKILSEA